MTASLSALGLAVKRLQVRHHRAADAALAAIGVSLVQWDALRHLAENPGASQHDLAVLTFQTDQAFGTLATRLESRGLIERVTGPGRAIRPQLTQKGASIQQQGAAILNGVLEESFAPLDASQRDTLGELLALLTTDR